MNTNVLRSTAVLAVAFAALTLGSAAHAAAPPSFSLWMAHWNAETDRTIGQPLNSCVKAFGESSAKAGSCVIAVSKTSYKAEIPRWSRQVAAIAKGQPATCRTAIHRYWLAASKAQAAFLIYFNASHPGITLETIARDLKSDPLATLGALSDTAKSHAIRVCG